MGVPYHIRTLAGSAYCAARRIKRWIFSERPVCPGVDDPKRCPRCLARPRLVYGRVQSTVQIDNMICDQCGLVWTTSQDPDTREAMARRYSTL